MLGSAFAIACIVLLEAPWKGRMLAMEAAPTRATTKKTRFLQTRNQSRIDISGHRTRRQLLIPSTASWPIFSFTILLPCLSSTGISPWPFRCDHENALVTRLFFYCSNFLW
ncbi:hypothetical protein KSP39_PZI008998 [Platanthera zijinensis]|uniref:Secreted protein n=1 Tax=Platanthera zijinensis TaxID=2320716 RepID=A0AAP0G7I2_9ASPA